MKPKTIPSQEARDELRSVIFNMNENDLARFYSILVNKQEPIVVEKHEMTIGRYEPTGQKSSVYRRGIKKS